MEMSVLSAGLARVNDKIVEAARADGQDTATFVCECGRCRGDFLALTLEEIDECRAREEPVLLPGH